jgi:hypothetical protein
MAARDAEESRADNSRDVSRKEGSEGRGHCSESILESILESIEAACRRQARSGRRNLAILRNFLKGSRVYVIDAKDDLRIYRVSCNLFSDNEAAVLLWLR